MLTAERVQAYLADSSKCPYCRSENIAGGECDYAGDKLYQDIECRGCGRTWTDEYTLSGMIE